MSEIIRQHPENPNNHSTKHPLKDRLYLGMLGERLLILAIGAEFIADSIIHPNNLSEYKLADGAGFAAIAVITLTQHIKEGFRQAREFSQQRIFEIGCYSGLLQDNREEFLRRTTERLYISSILKRQAEFLTSPI